MKALLENIETHFPKTHDLQKLLALLKENDIIIDIESAAIIELDSIYIDTRYPVDLGLVPEGNPTLEKVKRFFETAKSIYKQAINIMHIKKNVDGSNSAEEIEE
ncbi:hypothetical protein ES705_36813 [subsurface metagenome]